MRVSGEDLCVWRGREGHGGGWIDPSGEASARGRSRARTRDVADGSAGGVALSARLDST